MERRNNKLGRSNNLNINHFNKELTMFLRGKPRIINVLQKAILCYRGLWLKI